MARKIRRKKLESRIRYLMEERGILTIAELLRQVNDLGLKVSKYQLARFVDGHTAFWDPELIEAVLTVLRCDLQELWTTKTTTQPFSERREGKERA